MGGSRLAVIGAGPGGYAAAFMAADLGLEVTLVDPERNPGGVCLHRGCIPSKALLHAARLLDDAEAAGRLGLRFGEPSVDLDALRRWKDGVVERLTSGMGELTRRRKIRYLRGLATLVDGHTLEARLEGGRRERVTFDQAILATGSAPAALRGASRGSRRVLDSTSALELREIPRRLLVVGGGYIGLELGSVYARLGSRVTVVELAPALLAGVDADLVRPLQKRLAERLEDVLLRTRVARFEESDRAVLVTFEGERAPAAPREFDAVLVAVGRAPFAEGLGLERTAVERDDRGFVVVDEQRRTAEPSLFAIGDLAGQPMLAHKASHEGRLAAEVAAGRDVVWGARAVPAVVFTDPEIAWTGLTEAEAARQGRPVRALRFPWVASGRALTMDRTEGVTKLVVDPETGAVLGAGITGPGAAELVAEATLAVELGARAEDLALTIHAHPTLAETLGEAAESFAGTATHLYRPPRA